MNKILFWLGAAYAVFMVAWPTIQDKAKEYREKFPKEPEYDDEPEYSEPVVPLQTMPAMAGASPATSAVGTAMAPDQSFDRE